MGRNSGNLIGGGRNESSESRSWRTKATKIFLKQSTGKLDILPTWGERELSKRIKEAKEYTPELEKRAVEGAVSKGLEYSRKAGRNQIDNDVFLTSNSWDSELRRVAKLKLYSNNLDKMKAALKRVKSNK
jgi:hypothetical protein